MTYRELLALYTRGELDEQTRQKVESDIERQDAISEYLYDRTSLPDPDPSIPGADTAGAADAAQLQTTRMIRRAIRGAFIRAGVVTGTVVLAVVLFILFALPALVSQFYYDPTEIVAAGDDGMPGTDRMSLDLAVYSELFLPGTYRSVVNADPCGYGEYDITIPQTVSTNGRFTTVSGKLIRERLTLYDTNVLRRPTSNAFLFPQGTMGSFWNATDSRTGERVGPAGPQDEAYEHLKELGDDASYTAYISLTQVTDYASFYRWFEQKDLKTSYLWCAVYAEDENGRVAAENVGFAPRLAGECLDWDRDAYPHLSLLDASMPRLPDFGDAQLMQTHFISLMRYLQDDGTIVTMMDDGTYLVDIEATIRSVQADGLRIYGFSIEAQRDTLLSLCEDEAISYIYTKPRDY